MLKIKELKQKQDWNNCNYKKNEIMNEIKKLGFEPDNLENEIKSLEDEIVKLINEAESLMPRDI
ncbi:hypothetical protein [Thermobrachium celere]|uniref:hypothetical protein n=1 Tax=Thermobrachium celere TaxID=53422 RepID=UPI001FB023EB|nr:hypothetical protein [Thermobrachium celere]